VSNGMITSLAFESSTPTNLKLVRLSRSLAPMTRWGLVSGPQSSVSACWPSTAWWSPLEPGDESSQLPATIVRPSSSR
jgi:hypothetical protein